MMVDLSCPERQLCRTASKLTHLTCSHYSTVQGRALLDVYRGAVSIWVQIRVDGHRLGADLGLVLLGRGKAEVLTPECALPVGRQVWAVKLAGGDELVERVAELVSRRTGPRPTAARHSVTPPTMVMMKEGILADARREQSLKGMARSLPRM